MKKLYLLLSFFLLFAVVRPVAVRSEEYGYHGHWHGDIHHFREYDMDRWQHGYWTVRFHDGRNGWWWVVGDQWYYYPSPVYPYPNPYVPPTVVGQPSSPELYYWFCQNPTGYYPYVSYCYTDWQPVTVPPQPPAPQVVMPQPQYPSPPEEDTTERDRDDRMLDTLAAEFYRISSNDKNAADKLHNLANRVKTFRQSLFDRDYNAMDILRDAENLEKRIARKAAEAEHR